MARHEDRIPDPPADFSDAPAFERVQIEKDVPPPAEPPAPKLESVSVTEMREVPPGSGNMEPIERAEWKVVK